MKRPTRRGILLLPLVAGGLGIALACGPPTSGRTAAELFGEHCARCHGAEGRGEPAALSLSPALDLTRSTMVRRRARGLIFQRISDGYGSMPGFSHKLPRGDVDLLLEFVLTFGKSEEN